MEKVGFQYLGVLVTTEGGMEQEMGGWTRVASAVVRTLLQSTVAKRDLSHKANCTAAELQLVHRTIKM